MVRLAVTAAFACAAAVWDCEARAQQAPAWDEFSSGPSATASSTQLCAQQRSAALTEIQNRYAISVIEPLNEQRNLATAEYNKKAIDCAAASSNDLACVQAAQEELQQKMAELDKKRIDASTAEQNEMLRVEAQPCPPTAPASGSANSLGPFPLPAANPDAPLGSPGNPLQGRVNNEPDTPEGTPGNIPGAPAIQPDAAPLQPLQAQLDKVLSDAARNGLAATDQFFGGMAEAVNDNVKFLMQKPGVPAQQMGKAIWDYLTNDNAKNHEQLLQGAKQAVQDFQQNPARFLGNQAGNLAVSEATGGAAKLAGGVMKQLAGRAQAIAQAEKAATRLIAMNDAANEANAAVRAAESGHFTSAGGSRLPTEPAAGDAPMKGVVTAGDPAMEQAFPVNPRCLQNNCVPAVIAHDLNIKSPENLLRDYDIRFKSADNPTGYTELTQLLKEHYGSNPISGLTDEWRLQLQEEGIPIAATPAKIMNEIKNAPDGRAVVIFQREIPVQDAAGNWTTEVETHAVHAENVGGQTRIWDPQKEQGAMGAFLNSTKSWFYRTN